MQIDTCLFNEYQLHHFLLFHHQKSDTSEQFNLRRGKNTIEMQIINFCCNDFN